MDLITLDKTWNVAQYSSINSVLANDGNRGRYAYWSMKECLVDAGWTVTYSSDKTNVGATDYWTSYSKIFSTAVGAAHSWVVLTNSDFMADFAICIDCTPASTYLTNVTIVIAPDGFNANGTILNRPTVVSRSYTWTDTMLWSYAGDWGYTVKCLYSTDHECFRVILTNNGQCGDGDIGYSGGYFAIEKPHNPSSWWPTPFVVWCCAKANQSSFGLSYASLTTAAENNILTWIGDDVVQFRIGTICIGDKWISRQGTCAYGMSYDSSLVMPPMYYLSENTSFPGIFGVVCDMYPILPFHSPGTRYPTVGNSRGLIKQGGVALGCPYGYIYL